MWQPRLPHRLDGLPARDPCGESDLPAREGKGLPPWPPPLPSPVAHQRPKGWGRSHHQHPSLAARRYAGREGDTRATTALRFSATDAENACRSVSSAAFRESLQPQRRGLCPLRERRCAYQDRRHVRPPPPRRKGGGPSDGICLTPQRRESSIISRPCRTVSSRPPGQCESLDVGSPDQWGIVVDRCCHQCCCHGRSFCVSDLDLTLTLPLRTLLHNSLFLLVVGHPGFSSGSARK